MKAFNLFSNFMTKYMSALVLIIAIVALLQPWTFEWAAKYVTYLLGIVMFGMGMTLRWEDFSLVFKRPRDVFIGSVAHFTIMPALAWGLAKAFGLPPELAAGVILVGTCPSGTSSNVMTFLAKGDVALSVAIGITTTVLAPFITPLLTWYLVGAWVSVSLGAMFLSIFQVVVVPIALGIIINRFFGNFVKRAVKVLPLVSVIAIMLIVGAVVGISAQKILQTGLLIIGIVIIHNICGYTLGFCAAKLAGFNFSKQKAVMFEVGMQNSGLATSLALMHFTPAAAIPGAIFSVWHNISGSLLANRFAAKAENDAKAAVLHAKKKAIHA
ncbi:bile acid:sodium symporter family protein [Pectinatus cerevisiiphilus]|uniref:BASS family bile acid:Na+ symporter n=1 Tax=Pectinatus cerevisiiphilus TaxID=86956 RepID=A0A4R3K1N7_9FIRM|nr:bile acid:sodium symporter family protein [Pectinatus cerevisiiphilus]TCS75750.1 BASS family bile acid:Na+ symporter [Pectinatus cerevisiiphilus]